MFGTIRKFYFLRKTLIFPPPKEWSYGVLFDVTSSGNECNLKMCYSKTRWNRFADISEQIVAYALIVVSKSRIVEFFLRLKCRSFFFRTGYLVKYFSWNTVEWNLEVTRKFFFLNVFFVQLFIPSFITYAFHVSKIRKMLTFNVGKVRTPNWIIYFTFTYGSEHLTNQTCHWYSCIICRIISMKKLKRVVYIRLWGFSKIVWVLFSGFLVLLKGLSNLILFFLYFLWLYWAKNPNSGYSFF